MGGEVPAGPVDPLASVVSSAVGAFLTPLVVVAILVAVTPDSLERMMATVTEEPVGSFVYGLVALLAVVVVTVILVITIVDIPLAVPFAIPAAIIRAVRAIVANLAIADRLVGREDGWPKPLLVAAINGSLTLTGIGGIVSFRIGAAGFGAVLKGRLWWSG
jgi:hypothetical protein